ncbi:DUF2795 domain-containing protein [Actinomadura craniellae]|uniref:DUF2795 domain-containing protein n=1 Tax=Actinomadura craniellae TaxID=2231787 RepID=A0A365GXJ5_9ACTN|nr:DUF2795 domain-containing protein [Actinomadura craniellae]RAY11488.1 DUF2795 domain-containing protein [Actinomadura craniellae]
MAKQAEFIDIQRYLAGMDYPATKDQIIRHARSKGAKGEVLNALQRLAEGEYDSPASVSKAVAQPSR